MISPSPVRMACLLLILAAPGAVLAQPGAREAMAEAMARMMEVMGLFDPGPNRRGFDLPDANPMSMMGPLGASGWGSAVGVPWNDTYRRPAHTPAMAELMRRFSMHPDSRQPHLPDSFVGDWGSGSWPLPWTPSRLEGVWEGRDGELLIVQGNRFRIYSHRMQQLDGQIEIRDDRLALYNPQGQFAKPFEFTESQGRLVLRNPTGDVYLYRRLRLDRGQDMEDAGQSR